MKPLKLQKQLIMHDAASGSFGDCYRTCLACLLGIPASEVPHFFDQAMKHEDIVKAENECRDWLKARGYNVIRFCMRAEHKDAAAEWFDDTPYILTGMSPGSKELGHCVIGQGGFDVLWDVHPGRGPALAGPWVDNYGNEVYWCEFIVPRRVSSLVEEGAA